jgi:hypothetical protein
LLKQGVLQCLCYMFLADYVNKSLRPPNTI